MTTNTVPPSHVCVCKFVARGGMKSVSPAVEAAAATVSEARRPQIASTCADEIVRTGDAV